MDAPTLSQQCTLNRRVAAGGSGRYGGTSRRDESVELLAEIQQRSTEEIDGDVTGAEHLGILAAGTEIEPGDALVGPDGHEYEVVGEVNRVRDPWAGAAEHHVEVKLRRTAGEGAAS